MKIAVLAHNLSVGGGLYLGKAIVETLLRERPGDEFLITCPSSGWHDVYRPPNSRFIDVGVSFTSPIQRLYGETVVLRRQLRRFSPDVIFAAGNFGLLSPPCRQVVLAHESHLVYDAKHYGPLAWPLRLQVELQKRYFRLQLRKSELVLCQTDVMAKRVRSRYRYRGDTAILPNVLTSEHGRADAPPAEVAARLEGRRAGLRLAFITRYYAHKNLERLVETLATRSDELKDVVVFLTLDPNGNDGGGPVLRRIASSRAKDHIVNLGPIPQAAVGWLLARVDGVIVPTLLESFSASYLEAMQHGCPILTSDLDFARGVCGDAAAYFDPWSVGEIAKVIRRVRDDLDYRHALGNAARNQLAANIFMPQAFAATLHAAIDGCRQGQG